MKVKFFALLRSVTGCNESDDFNGDTVADLLAGLGDHYGEELSRWIFAPRKAGEAKELSGNVIILVNGRAIEHLNGLETPLKGDDEVAIFPRLAGG